ncbi:MAG TPA: DUF512 domain-containing protein, partial [Coriobacteriia bacterium]
GELFAPVLAREVEDAARRGLALRVVPAANRFFGGNVSVTGLLTAADIAAAVREDGAAATYLVPDVVLGSDERTLDDVPAAGLAAHCGADVRVVSSDAAALVAALLAVSEERS